MANRFFPNYDTYKITDKYGERIIFGSKSFHHGIDLVAKTSNGGSMTDYIMAHTGGTVALVGYNDSIGNYIYIQTAPNVQMVYFHFRDKLDFKVGDKIQKGQILGYMGATGQVTGPHLHWGIMVNGEWIDPEPYLDKDYSIVNYVGFLDKVTNAVISGWAWNSVDDTALKVEVKIYRDSKLVKTLSTVANKYRSDLKKAGKGNGKHGFSINFDFNTLGSGTYTVKAYTNGKELLNVKKVEVKTPKYTGRLDKTNSKQIGGWAWNSINDSAVKVDIKICNKTGKVVKTLTTTAKTYRADLKRAKKGNGKHGFNIKFNFATLPTGTYTVTAFVNNVKLPGIKNVKVQKK